MLTFFFRKAHEDAQLDPLHTSMYVVVPDIRGVWDHWTRHYEVIHRYSRKDTARTFTRPKAGLHAPTASTPAGNEGGPGRVFRGECPHDVLVLYRDSNTPMATDDYVKAHLRFGHFDTNRLSKMVASGTPTGLTLDQNVLQVCNPMCYCEACKLTKATRPPKGQPRPVDRREDMQIFGTVASDLCGPIYPPSISGKRYCLHFQCLTTMWAACYFLTTKGEALQYFKMFLELLAKLDIKPHLLVIRTDNAGEYVGGQFKTYCDAIGVTQQTSAQYMHEQNGFAEVSFRVVFWERSSYAIGGGS